MFYLPDLASAPKKKKVTPLKLQFFSFITSIFESDLSIFQTEFPMFPFMYKEWKKCHSCWA